MFITKKGLGSELEVGKSSGCVLKQTSFDLNLKAF